MRIWVIGAGGLLGSSLVRIATLAGAQITTSTKVPWADADMARAHLLADARNFLFSLREHPGGWSIVWAAGQATTSSSVHDIDDELSFFESFISGLSQMLKRDHSPGRGNFLLASSAGGIYGGAKDPPFSASTPPSPVGSYGQLKLAQEDAVLQHLPEFADVTVARFANIYGPGQDLAKLQGLISRLAVAALTRIPLTMFVPLATMRDYIYVDDASNLALHWMKLSQEPANIRVVASGQPTSLGQLISLMEKITHSRLPIAYGFHSSATQQATDLRLIPDMDQESSRWPLMPLPAGAKLVYQDILSRAQLGGSATRMG